MKRRGGTGGVNNAGTCRAARELRLRDAPGDRDSEGQPGVWSQGDQELPKAAGPVPRDAQPQERMLSSQAGWLIFAQHHSPGALGGWDAWLLHMVPTPGVGCGTHCGRKMWKSHPTLQNLMDAFPSTLGLAAPLPSPLCPGQGAGDAPWAGSLPCPRAHPLAPPGQEHLHLMYTTFPRQREPAVPQAGTDWLECWKRSWGCWCQGLDMNPGEPR